MNKHTPIIISIPNPCLESWDEMTPMNGGRFCAHCSKKVTDFSNFTDHQLFNHIKNHGLGCGRYNASQLNRSISIPYQPHSQLYRIAIALGLTLIVSQTPILHAQNKPPLKAQKSLLYNNESNEKYSPNGLIRGTILIAPLVPAHNVTVLLNKNGLFAAITTTDSNGNYNFHSLDSGNYEIIASLPGYDSIRSTVNLKANDSMVLNMSFYLSSVSISISATVALPTQTMITGTSPQNYIQTYKTHKTKRKKNKTK